MYNADLLNIYAFIFVSLSGDKKAMTESSIIAAVEKEFISNDEFIKKQMQNMLAAGLVDYIDIIDTKEKCWMLTDQGKAFLRLLNCGNCIN